VLVNLNFGDEEPDEPRELTYKEAGTINAIRIVQISNNLPEQRPVWTSSGVAEDSQEGNTDHLWRNIRKCNGCGLNHRGEC
jgi:hypothetical protein